MSIGIKKKTLKDLRQDGIKERFTNWCNDNTNFYKQSPNRINLAIQLDLGKNILYNIYKKPISHRKMDVIEKFLEDRGY